MHTLKKGIKTYIGRDEWCLGMTLLLKCQLSRSRTESSLDQNVIPEQSTNMGIVEDVRQIFQDFLAPELRALSARIDASDKVAESRHNELLSKIQLVDQKVEYLVREAISRIGTAESNLQIRIESLIHATNVEKRLDRLEGLRTEMLSAEVPEQKRA
jgi:hypothetical protein